MKRKNDKHTVEKKGGYQGSPEPVSKLPSMPDGPAPGALTNLVPDSPLPSSPYVDLPFYDQESGEYDDPTACHNFLPGGMQCGLNVYHDGCHQWLNADGSIIEWRNVPAQPCNSFSTPRGKYVVYCELKEKHFGKHQYTWE